MPSSSVHLINKKKGIGHSKPLIVEEVFSTVLYKCAWVTVRFCLHFLEFFVLEYEALIQDTRDTISLCSDSTMVTFNTLTSDLYTNAWIESWSRNLNTSSSFFVILILLHLFFSI